MPGVVEKRKQRRVKASLPIRIVYQNSLELEGRTENISILGAYMESDRQLLPGTELAITLKLPDYTPDAALTGLIRCKGHIFRCGPARGLEAGKAFGTGIFFTDFLSPDDRQKLLKYIDYIVINEDREIKKNLKRWQKKRDMTKKKEHDRRPQAGQEEFQAESLGLLKQILTRLEEISRDLGSKDNPSFR